MRPNSVVSISGHTFVATGLGPSSIVLDLGANQGSFAKGIVTSFGSRVVAVEPTPDLARNLRSIPGVTVVECAVGSSTRRQAFQFNEVNSEASRLSESPSSNAIWVEVLTLEKIILRVGVPDLIKMDIEGSEIEALAATEDTVLCQVPQITVEFHDFDVSSGISRGTVASAISRMKSIGFHTFRNSLRTYGDVLFLNSRHFSLSKFDCVKIAYAGKWSLRLKRRLLLHNRD